jgi:sugar lactone lactonase YvrE
MRAEFVALVAALLLSDGASADDYASARADLVEAYQQQDFGAMVDAAKRALQARPAYPGALFNLALAQALAGDADASLATLQQLADRGVDFGVDAMDEFRALHELPGWAGYRGDLAVLREPVGDAEVVLELDEDRFVPEGIAIDADGSILLGSIHTGRLLRVQDGVQELSDGRGHWSVFGMRLHDDGSVWFASAAVPQLAGVGEAVGRTGLFRFDLRERNLMTAAKLPHAERRQVLGDLVIAGDVIYTTDSLGGAVYRYDIETGAFTALVEAGALGSPQGLVIDESGEYLYVADYIGGLYRVALEDGSRKRLTVPETVTDFGIDGLYRHGRDLIAIQNGVRPHRVVALRLAEDGVTVTASRVLAANLPQFDEPTLGVIRGDDFYFVANSHWNRFSPDNSLPDGLTGPIVLRVSLHAD